MWTYILIGIIGSPLLIYGPWWLAVQIESSVPGCRAGSGSSKTCMLGGIDIAGALDILASPMLLVTEFLTNVVLLLCAWLALGCLYLLWRLGKLWRLRRQCATSHSRE